ncbi:hypothetical protein ACP4OV_014726 [Aristida adscensionis]
MGEKVFSERLGYSYPWTDVRPLEEKIIAWIRERPVIWNVGIGSAGSFVPTLTRLLFERSKDLYGPYEHIICVRLTHDVAVDNTEAQHWLAVEVLMEMASTLKIPLPDDKLQMLKQLAAEDSYHGYVTISENLMLEAFGREYIESFWSDPSVLTDPNYDLQPYRSLILERIWEICQGKRHLMLVENLHDPVLLDVFFYTMGSAVPRSAYMVRRWLISTTSKDACDKSRQLSARNFRYWEGYRLGPRYYNDLPFDDLGERSWAMLIKEALRDAASSIHKALQQHQNEQFWLRVAQHCLYYAILFDPLQGGAAHQASSATLSSSSVSSDDLVRCWMAERLLCSITSPFDIPETTGKKQSSYRSAYEAGKAAIQALQEYSLLPVYSVSSPTSSTLRTANTSGSSPQDDITGVSQLAMGVPRLSQDELYDQKKIHQLRWVSFMNDDGRHVSWDWRSSNWSRDVIRAEFIPGKMNTSTLVLRGCSNIQAFPFDKTLSGPPQTSEKEASPLAHLGKLEVLDMNGVPLLELTQQDASNKSNLHYLDISGSRITTLPPKFFSGMDMFEALQRLHTLKLINNKQLTSLPRSLSKAKHLKELHIYGCVSLMLEFLWELVPWLEDLYIQTWEGLEDIKIHEHPNLRTLALSGPWIRCLSMRGCSRLKTVNFSDNLTTLEDVDLSGTDIEEVPHNLPNLPHLWKLLLLNVPCFKRFPWHKLVRKFV